MRPDQRHQGRQRRDIKVNALAGEGFALSVQGQMLAELCFQDHHQKVRARPPAGNRMERGGWLGDLLARPAGEFLPHGLDDFPLPGNDFQSLGDRFAKLGQRAATARTGAGRFNDHAFARQMPGQRRTDWLATGKRRHR
jgi:hypothetical protein